MTNDRRTALAALAAAGTLWGTSVPLTKLALEWLPPAWLTVARFGLAAVVLLTVVRNRVGAACGPAVLAWGAAGYGGSILLQNAGLTRTSVSHAALLVGATPVMVAVIAALRHRAVARPVAWAGFAVSLAGVGLVAVGGSGGATLTGDVLVLASLVFSASFTVAQARLLSGRDPVAVTAVQFLAAALAALPVAAVTEGVPAVTGDTGGMLAGAGLTLLGTLAPSTLFAYGQARVAAEVAGAFVNLEPLVGAAAGAVVFGDPVGMALAAGGAAIVTGIALSSLPLVRAGHPWRRGRRRSPRRRPRAVERPAYELGPVVLELGNNQHGNLAGIGGGGVVGLDLEFHGLVADVLEAHAGLRDVTVPRPADVVELERLERDLGVLVPDPPPEGHVLVDGQRPGGLRDRHRDGLELQCHERTPFAAGCRGKGRNRAQTARLDLPSAPAT
jgi:O-acetylserine/cysteine efflux transporter